MNTTTGAQLGVQAVLRPVGSPAPEPGRLRPYEPWLLWKPGGGMWTSTHQPGGYICGWAEWCRSASWGTGPHDLWLLTPEPDAAVAEIDTYEDLAELHETFGARRSRATFRPEFLELRRSLEQLPGAVDNELDFEAIASRFAGIHLTTKGQRATHLSWPLNLYSWDSECTWWARWAFVKVEHAGTVTIEAPDDEDDSL